MKLPKLKTPIYETTLPSGMVVKFRPFVLGEEKILLMASEGGDKREIIDAIKTTVTSCVMVPDDFDVNILPEFDLEFLLLQFRAKSVNEIVSLNLTCEKCEKKSPVELNINENINVIKTKNHTNNIPLTKEIGVVMKYPSLDITNKEFEGVSGSVQNDIWLIKSCMESIYDKDKVYPIKDSSKEELDEFINSLNRDQYNDILNFFKTAPKVTCMFSWDCSNPECENKNMFLLEGLLDFFI